MHSYRERTVQGTLDFKAAKAPSVAKDSSEQKHRCQHRRRRISGFRVTCLAIMVTSTIITFLCR